MLKEAGQGLFPVPHIVAHGAAEHPESADRPKWSALDNRMLRCTVGNDVRDWKEALACFFAHWDGENGMK